MSVARATIPAMPRNPDPLPARVVPAGADAGLAALTAELPSRVRAELPAVGELGGSGSRSWYRSG